MSSSWFIDIEHSRSWPGSLLRQILIVWYSRIGASFLKVRKAVVFIQDRGVDCFSDVMIKLSANKTNWTGWFARTHAFQFCLGLISGPKSYWDFPDRPRPTWDLLSFCEMNSHSNCWICRRNVMALPFKWNLNGRSFAQYYLYLTIWQKPLW